MLEVIDTYDRKPLPPEFASLDSEVGFFLLFFFSFYLARFYQMSRTRILLGMTEHMNDDKHDHFIGRTKRADSLCIDRNSYSITATPRIVHVIGALQPQQPRLFKLTSLIKPSQCTLYLGFQLPKQELTAW